MIAAAIVIAAVIVEVTYASAAIVFFCKSNRDSDSFGFCDCLGFCDWVSGCDCDCD
jgi:hypothetical protein